MIQAGLEHKTINQLTGLSKVELHRLDREGSLTPSGKRGGRGTGNRRAYSPADVTAAMLYADLKALGATKNCASLMKVIQAQPAWKGREQREDGQERLFPEDFPRYLLFDGQAVQATDAFTQEELKDRSVLISVDLHHYVGRMILLLTLATAPEEARLERFAELSSRTDPVGAATRRLVAEMQRGDISSADAARLLGVSKSAIAVVRLRTRRPLAADTGQGSEEE